MNHPHELRTQRTVVRPFVREDAAEAFTVFGDPVVMRYAAGEPDPTREATCARIERYIEHQDRHDFSKWAVRDAVSGAYLGDSGILHLTETGELELGYRLAHAHWGRGLATEVASAWLRHAIEVLRLPRVIAFADRRNAASIRVLEKIGMPFERLDRLCEMDCVVHAVGSMEYAGDPKFQDVDARWIVGGPDSGGVRFFVLWRAHLFLVEQDFNSESISRGTPAPKFAAAFRGSPDPRYRQIVEDLDARGLSRGTG